ncbi:trypsin-like serine peptidase, partial [Bacillus mycoides]
SYPTIFAPEPENCKNIEKANFNICNDALNCAGTQDNRKKLETTDFNVVRITCNELDGINGQWGTGIVIGPNRVLTAAHVTEIQRFCFGDPLIVYQGGNGIGSVAQKYPVASMKIHPSYNRNADNHFEHDLAVLTTTETFTQYKPFSRAPDPLDFKGLTWTGYPSDLVQRDRVFSQWETQHPLYRDNGSLYIYNLHVCAVSEVGQSGSGLITVDNGNVIGILARRMCTRNSFKYSFYAS